MVNILMVIFAKIQRCKVKDNAKINSESPAWAFDRLSILALKIYHMNEEATRAEASQDIEINVKQIKHPVRTKNRLVYCN
jgi:hypothetical protein